MRTWILDRFHDYARFCLVAAIFLSPVIFSRKTQDVFNLLKFTVLLILGIAALLLYVAWSAERGVWLPRFKLGVTAATFLLACLIATLFSEDRVLSLVGLYHRYGGLIPFALYAAIMVAIVGLYWERPALLRGLAKASVGASLLMTSYVIIQALGLDWIPWKDSSGGPPPYPVGTMGNSNFAGGYLGIALPFVIYVAATTKKDFTKTLAFVLVGVDVLALWFTQTRGGMIAAGAGVLTMAFAYRDRLPKWMRLTTVGGVVVAVLLAFLVLVHPGTKEPPGPLARVEALRTGTFSVRTYYWQTAIRIFEDRPITGVGLDLYYANYPRQRLPQDGSQLGLTITDKPHNIFLEYLANTGVLGFASYLALIGLALWYGLRTATNNDANRFLLTSFVSVLAGYLAQGIFSIDVPPLAVMGWIAIGGIAAIADPGAVSARDAITAERAQPRGKPGKKSKAQARPQRTYRVARHGRTLWGLHAVLAVAMVAVAAIGVRPAIADTHAKDAASLQADKSAAERAADEYDKAIALHPLEGAYRSQAGAWAESRASSLCADAQHCTSTDRASQLRLFKSAEKYYEEALRLQPGNIFFTMNLARLYQSWAEKLDPRKFSISDSWWKKAVALDPTDWDVHGRYALMLNSYSNSLNGERRLRAASAEQLKIAVRIKPDYVQGLINLSQVQNSLGETQTALATARNATRKDPSSVLAWVNLAKLDLAQGKRQDALAAARTAARIDPSNEEAARLLQSLSA